MLIDGAAALIGTIKTALPAAFHAAYLEHFMSGGNNRVGERLVHQLTDTDGDQRRRRQQPAFNQPSVFAVKHRPALDTADAAAATAGSIGWSREMCIRCGHDHSGMQQAETAVLKQGMDALDVPGVDAQINAGKTAFIIDPDNTRALNRVLIHQGGNTAHGFGGF